MGAWICLANVASSFNKLNPPLVTFFNSLRAITAGKAPANPAAALAQQTKIETQGGICLNLLNQMPTMPSAADLVKTLMALNIVDCSNQSQTSLDAFMREDTNFSLFGQDLLRNAKHEAPTLRDKITPQTMARTRNTARSTARITARNREPATLARNRGPATRPRMQPGQYKYFIHMKNFLTTNPGSDLQSVIQAHTLAVTMHNPEQVNRDFRVFARDPTFLAVFPYDTGDRDRILTALSTSA
jgi:hypothetical protein